MTVFADFLPSLTSLSAPPVLAIVLCLAAFGALLDVRDWFAARQRRMDECAHRWVYVSAWDEGRFWHRVCRNCPRQEVVPFEDVPEWWRRQERADRASSPRAAPSRRTSVIRSRLHRSGRR